MREAIRIVLTLLLLCTVSGGALAAVYGTTAPIIAEQQAKALQEGLAQVLPGAAKFDEVPADKWSGAGAAVKNVWTGTDAGGKAVGHVAEVAPVGYGGPIRTLVGVNAEGKVVQTKILAAAGETPGLGSKVTEPKWQDQFKGGKLTVPLLKGKAGGTGEVQAITGATISSKAVVDGVNQALAAIQKLSGGR